MKQPNLFEMTLSTGALMVHVEKLAKIARGTPEANEAMLLVESIYVSWPESFKRAPELVPIPSTPDCSHFAGKWFGEWRSGHAAWEYPEASAPTSTRCFHPAHPPGTAARCEQGFCPKLKEASQNS